MHGLRSAGAVRTVLISYGVVAFGFLSTRTVPVSTVAVFGGIPAWGLVLCGVVLQVLMFAGHALIGRHAPDHVTAARGKAIIELIGDGVTVLLFALGTLGGILQTAAGI